MKTASLWGAIVALAGTQDPQVPGADLLKIAATYESYGKVDDQARWGPFLCIAPPRPAALRASASKDEKTHGKKLYYLFAKDRQAYVQPKDKTQPVGQVIVKEAWIPAATSTPERPVAGERGPLYIMMKTGDPAGDEGWIYATTSPDRKTLTASGKIASCMECHQTKTRDRIFGLPSSGGGAHENR
jgi:hypothetical protein